MEIHNATTTPNKSNQLLNINTVRCESRNITKQPGEIHFRNIKRAFYLDVLAILNQTELKTNEPYANYG